METRLYCILYLDAPRRAEHTWILRDLYLAQPLPALIQNRAVAHNLSHLLVKKSDLTALIGVTKYIFIRQVVLDEDWPDVAALLITECAARNINAADPQTAIQNLLTAYWREQAVWVGYAAADAANFSVTLIGYGDRASSVVPTRSWVAPSLTWTRPSEISTSWDLETACWDSATPPGWTYTLLEGTYQASCYPNWIGTVEQPITLQGQGRARIDGTFSMTGANCIVRDLEVLHSQWPDRTGTSQVADFTINSPGTKVINCIIHDMFCPFSGQNGGDWYGCVVSHSGYLTDRGHGHNIYIQGNVAFTKIVKHCVFLASFGWGIHAYTTDTSIDNLRFEENVSFKSGELTHFRHYHDILIGGLTPAAHETLIGNRTYSGEMVTIGYNRQGPITDVVLQNNYFPEGKQEAAPVEYTSSEGNFLGPHPANGQVATVWPNAYEAGRATITLYNWDNADTIIVDVTGILNPGAAYRLHNTQDFYADVVQGEVAQDNSITIDMRAIAHTVQPVIGNWPAEATTFPTFGCFVLRAG